MNEESLYWAEGALCIVLLFLVVRNLAFRWRIRNHGFDKAAINAISRAYRRADKRRQSYSYLHLLLSLVEDRENMVSRTLQKLGFDLQKGCDHLVMKVDNAPIVLDPQYEFMKAVSIALAEAGEARTNTAHLMLGLIQAAPHLVDDLLKDTDISTADLLVEIQRGRGQV